jgi:hypothetical protein
MRKQSFAVSALVLAIAGIAPPAASGADSEVAGKGPRIRGIDGRLIAAPVRPVFVVVDELAAFGRLPPAQAPPLRIEIQGDVEITPQPDGGLRIRFLHEEE